MKPNATPYRDRPQVVLDADTIAKLIAAKRDHLIAPVLGDVLMPELVQEDLKKAGYTRDWATNPPANVEVLNPKGIDPGIIEWNAQRHNRRIDKGEAAAISLAKEIANETGRVAIVVSDDAGVRRYLKSAGDQQRVFATDFWSVVNQASEKGLVNLAEERNELERFNTPGSKEEFRDALGFTPKDRQDQVEAHFRQHGRNQARQQQFADQEARREERHTEKEMQREKRHQELEQGRQLRADQAQQSEQKRYMSHVGSDSARPGLGTGSASTPNQGTQQSEQQKLAAKQREEREEREKQEKDRMDQLKRARSQEQGH